MNHEYQIKWLDLYGGLVKTETWRGISCVTALGMIKALSIKDYQSNIEKIESGGIVEAKLYHLRQKPKIPPGSHE